MAYFRKLYEYWLAFGMAIGVVVTPIQLFLVYQIVFGPARLFTMVARKDLLDRKFDRKASFWREKRRVAHTVEEARHQF